MVGVGSLGVIGDFYFMGPFHGPCVGVTHAGSFKVLACRPGSVEHDIRAADFNGEIAAAVAFRSGECGIFMFTADGSHYQIYDGCVSTMTLGDFNQDGKLDIASINWGESGDSTVMIHYQK